MCSFCSLPFCFYFWAPVEVLHSCLFFWALAFLGLLTTFSVAGDVYVGNSSGATGPPWELTFHLSPFTMCEMGGTGRTS